VDNGIYAFVPGCEQTRAWLGASTTQVASFGRLCWGYSREESILSLTANRQA
jgi:hypothetical protein